MTECICGYRYGSTKIAYMLHLRLSYLWFWSGTVWRMNAGTKNMSRECQVMGVKIMGVKRRWGKKAHLQTETLFYPLYIYKKTYC